MVAVVYREPALGMRFAIWSLDLAIRDLLSYFRDSVKRNIFIREP